MSQARSISRPTAQQAIGIYRTLLKPLYWWYEQRLSRAVLAGGKLPKHLGIILDGNRRFARSIGVETHMGHDLGAHKAYEVLEWCLALGIPHVTLWVFSSDNKSRDPQEVAHLLELFAREAAKMVHDPRIHNNAVRIKLIGQIEDFPESTRKALHELEQATAHYQGMLLHIAIGYGGREEIVGAIRSLLRAKAAEGKSLEELSRELQVSDIEEHLYTAGAPDPDFIVRTSGEVRLSGFLLWQAAYSEYYFCDAYWPSFRKVDFLRALRSFQSRERRFGR
ncbi:short-chain Z-isoprenyl diphosphate synthase [Deinobacterium chartae]|uniref:Isoprenyl transferase n=1 Tax=Deinobacterium chartae TaxID=521158 RepID=A0A841I349_9DEIO|nr:short-chain Z-isoprenyl diphosphate synthase [Deinobacterium chartae]